MKHIFILTILLVNIGLLTNAQDQKMDWVSKVGATKFPQSTKIFTVRASTDTVKVITKAIQKAIDDCAAKGGGIVQFAPGIYVSGAIFIKSNVQLKIDKGVIILGSQNFNDYPDIDTRVAGIEMKWPAALINIMNATNAALTGRDAPTYRRC